MPVTPETRAMVLLAAQICDEKKATDTRILELDPVDAGFTDFFLITSATNNRQTGAIADEIELRMKREFGTYAKAVEGRRGGEWILLDYLDFVVHIFTEQTREFYDIERLRKSARSMDADELAAMLQERTEAARKKAPSKKASPAREDAPIVSVKKSAKKALAKRDADAPTAVKKAAKKVSAKSAVKKAPARSAAKKAAKKAPAESAAKKSPAKKSATSGIVEAATSAKAKKGPLVEDTSHPALPAGKPASKRLPAPGTQQ